MLAFTLRFIKNKRYFAILAGALVIIAGLTSQHAWSGNFLKFPCKPPVLFL